MNEDLRNEVFDYLDALRESGATNMFGATPYLMEEFGFDKHDAKRWLTDWMQTFSERHPRPEVTEDVEN